MSLSRAHLSLNSVGQQRRWHATASNSGSISLSRSSLSLSLSFSLNDVSLFLLRTLTQSLSLLRSPSTLPRWFFGVVSFSVSFSHSLFLSRSLLFCMCLQNSRETTVLSIWACLVDFFKSFLVPLATPDSINLASSHSFKNQPKSHTFWQF
ncbi:unnamed protein product [Camellia sinensis]